MNKYSRICAIVLSLGLFTLGPTISPVNAANKAGGKCSKANSKVKIGGDTYVCTKNPTIKNAGLTWVWKGCLDANKLYLDATVRLKEITASAASAKKLLEADIAKIKAELPTYESKAKIYDQKAADAKAKQAKAVAEAKSATDNANKYGPTTKTGVTFLKAAATWTKAANSYGAAATNFSRSAQSWRDKANGVTSKQKQLAVVDKNLADSKAEVKYSLQNRNQSCAAGL